MRQREIPQDIIKYVLNFVELRFSSTMGQNNCGVPQGDPLSMLLFCMAIDPILEKLQNEYHLEFIAYADDILIYVENENDIESIIEIASKLFLTIGL